MVQGKGLQIVCPHCGVRGQVTTRRGKAKQGVSGGKATAGLLTGGASLLLVGLSRKQKVTFARCRSCRSHWSFG